ncbi:BglG family transcription antiterminator [Breznakia pachnodae]|uniref:Lichenan operon transcriptional antiterminator n=1 Tax=Breznakia pachnodae TaxID=265178 RepID=A0ABU0E0B6_9FIRM|nr:BglG family transcription antiterminator [Breznakia pachnodae]MDQ0360331.1 lichenan operon transcriptional antiterminator [Breznakia pachnodae]
MLTNRQFKIIQTFIDNDDYVSSKQLSTLFHVSSRSVKNDITTIKQFLVTNYNGIQLISVPSKGYLFEYDDLDSYSKLKVDFNDSNLALSYEDEQILRSKKIILLLFENKYITKWNIIDQLFISESTFYSDLKEVEVILQKYNLKISQKKQSGYFIIGSEKDKRLCLIKENIYNFDEDKIYHDEVLNIQNISKISETLSDILLKYQYRTSDTLLENLIVHIVITLERIRRGNLIDELISIPNVENLKEYKIAKAIFNSFLQPTLSINDEHLKNEVIQLTANLLGKSEYDQDTLISKETNTFIQESLEKIKNEFNVDFTNDVDLKISLSLHLVPLLNRVRYGMQQKSKMAKEIKVSFPLATDVASYFTLLIQQKYALKVSDDEITFLSLYFNYSLDSLKTEEDAKNILIITSLRQSETILIRQKFMHWFKNQIESLSFVRPNEAIKDLSNYDAIFTTDAFEDDRYSGAVVKIGLFPNDEDYVRINHALYGFTSAESVLSKLDKDLVFIGKAKNKEDVLNKLFKLSKEHFDLDHKFKKSVLEREDIGNTYYGSKIAMPHPLSPITKETFVALALLENEIDWGENQKVQIIIMVCTEMNNPKAFQFWHYISLLVSNDKLIHKLLNNLTYDNFISLMRTAILPEFN